MSSLDTLVASVDTELEDEFRKRFLDELKGKDRAWLEEELLNRVMHDPISIARRIASSGGASRMSRTSPTANGGCSGSGSSGSTPRAFGRR